jgi:riboflavin synthase
MYTGLIEKQGTLKSRIPKKNMYRITINVDDIWNDLTLGESIAVNGVCVTVTEFTANSFSADISMITLRDTTMKDLKPGTNVNLERCIQVGERFGGHIVQGHVDGTGKIISCINRDDNLIIRISVEYKMHKLITPKASIAVDGVSLTVQDLDSNTFTIVIIPHSAKNTNLQLLKTGCKVNIEIDVLAKYVYHFASKN